MKYIVFYFVYNGWKEYPRNFYIFDTKSDAQEFILSLAQEAQYEDYLDLVYGNEVMSMEKIMDEVDYLGGYAEYYHYEEANCYGS